MMTTSRARIASGRKNNMVQLDILLYCTYLNFFFIEFDLLRLQYAPRSRKAPERMRKIAAPPPHRPIIKALLLHSQAWFIHQDWWAKKRLVKGFPMTYRALVRTHFSVEQSDFESRSGVVRNLSRPYGSLAMASHTVLHTYGHVCFCLSLCSMRRSPSVGIRLNKTPCGGHLIAVRRRRRGRR